MKKILGLFTAVMLCAMAMLGLGACEDLGLGVNTDDALSSNEVYAMSALSSATYLASASTGSSDSLDALISVSSPINNSGVCFGSISSVVNGYAPNSLFDPETESRPAELGEDAPRIKSYIQMFQGIIMGNGLEQTISVPNETEDGEYAIYATKMTVMLPTIAGDYVTYIMYYDEIALEQEQPDTNENIGYGKYGEQKGNHGDEVSTTLVGVLVVNNEVYDVIGEKDVEISDSETEIEIKFTTKSRDNPTDYIVVKQEIEQGEIEYKYSVYRDGLLVERTKVGRENKHGQEEFTIRFMSLTEDGYISVKYSIEKSDEQDSTFLVKYTDGSIECKIRVRVEGDSYTFTYANGYREDID
ncbi:MAG: hypothetical protein PHW00_06200 [Clostridia bacterium]|nr:hypothetical protein [Clostridia bacterium]